MANNNLKVWCLLIDNDHKPIFGEPFPMSMRLDDTIHELKKKIGHGGYGTDKFPDVSPNELEIWKCKAFSRKLSANDSFGRTKKYLGDFRFSDDEHDYSDVEHLGVTRLLVELPLEPGELLLVLMPRCGMQRSLIRFLRFFTELPIS